MSLPTTPRRRPLTNWELVAALSDIPAIRETDAWFIARARNASVLEVRVAALLADAQLVTHTDELVAWSSRRYSATIVYWVHDVQLELTSDEDLGRAITTILSDLRAWSRRPIRLDA